MPGALIWIKQPVSAMGQCNRMELEPGDPAPGSGVYERLNVFGTPTGKAAIMAKGESLPHAPRGFTWRPLSERSPADLRAGAAGYRRMAGTARTATVAESLRKLADRFEALADQPGQAT